MRYVIYTRVSTNKQTVENQIHICREYVYKLRQKGDEILEFSEPDKSTQRPMSQRKKLLEMMSNLRSGDQLVVYKVDRLARDKQELINIYCDIRKKGVQIIGIRDPSLNEESICIYAFVACTERKNIQERTRDGLRRKKAQGERTGSTMYGYRLDETKLQTREDCQSYGKPYLLIPDDREQEHIKVMKEMYENGASFGDIMREFKARGWKNRNGNTIHKSGISKILSRLGVSHKALQLL